MRICLLGCSKSKRDYKTTALDMYLKSSLFKYKYKAAQSLNPDKIYIISGKYNLLHLDDIIEPYNYKLSKKRDIKIWSEQLIENLIKENIDLKNDEIYIFAGKPYYNDYLLSNINNYHIITFNTSGSSGRYYTLYKKIIETGKYV